MPNNYICQTFLYAPIATNLGFLIQVWQWHYNTGKCRTKEIRGGPQLKIKSIFIWLKNHQKQMQRVSEWQISLVFRSQTSSQYLDCLNFRSCTEYRTNISSTNIIFYYLSMQIKLSLVVSIELRDYCSYFDANWITVS